MIYKLIFLISLLYLATLTNAQNLKCVGKYELTMIGDCMLVDDCTGAAVEGNCSTSEFICCIAESSAPPDKAENKIITKDIFLKIAGNTKRNQAIYNYFVESLEMANITTEYQAAAYLSQLIGESKYFKSMESSGYNLTGDSLKFRGRGAILLRGKTNYELANDKLRLSILDKPENVAFPSVGFKVAGWFWRENAYVIKEAEKAEKSNLNELADGTFVGFTHLTHSLTTNLKSLKERALINDKILAELKHPSVKRGQGVSCNMVDGEVGYAVPICLLDHKRSYCGCEGKYEKNTCTYGKLSNGQCRNSATVKCCVEKCSTHLDLVILMDSSGSIGFKDFQKEKDFVKTLFNNLEIGTNASRVSIINFNSQPSIIINLANGISNITLNKVVDDIVYSGGNIIFISINKNEKHHFKNICLKLIY